MLSQNIKFIISNFNYNIELVIIFLKVCFKNSLIKFLESN